jgi:hypothetical protein
MFDFDTWLSAPNVNAETLQATKGAGSHTVSEKVARNVTIGDLIGSRREARGDERAQW